jgi:3-dehydroquinate synthase
VDGRRGSSRVGTSNLVLIGFMGTGKSTLGALCAQRLGYTFHDTDALVVERAGRSIPEIFADEGEAGFRARECAIVAELAAGKGQVIATGGGVVLNPENAMRLRATACLIGLRARVDTVLNRVGDTESRPLLAATNDPAARIAALLSERSPVYAKNALRCFDTDLLSPSQLATEIVDWYRSYRGEPTRIQVALADRSYPILIQKGILASGVAAEKISESVPAQRVCIVTHPGLRAPYAAPIEAGLRAHGVSVTTVTIPPGERYKTLKTVARLYDAFLKAGLDRKGLVVAVGGGVLGDITGFAAATYLRGIRVVQVPTTLLAQVDSSVGGKTGVDLPAGKNLVGAFHQPSFVAIDPDTLITLPARELRSGLAEVIKYGIIYDAGFFEEVARNLAQLRRRGHASVVQSIVRSCRIKAEIVAQDETEQGVRAILNFGHTVGHALEAVTRYRRYKHGEAISIGMVSASMIGERLGVTPPGVTSEICRVLRSAHLPTAFPMDIDPGLILEAAGRDKKTEGGRLRFVLARAVGEVCVHNDVPASAIVESLERQRCGEFEHE